ncbi:hypothetical protein DL89DRAFT_266772, partial [Linderina pennispora]
HLKGGVWKNTEDEILKAAVMKYGKTQWARISSLLVRKTPKQCKARWYEWLDPSIKKTEWSKEEDEKLLHLAKLMPTQWRTIAPIVGRTPAQCLERYQRLLDEAEALDMDEDEKDMLSEARARLANTQGKKAKRKARERQLEEARRLATLQKRRELRAAGIELKPKKKKKNAATHADYNAEIPLEQKPLPGFYDTTEELARKTDGAHALKGKFLDSLERKSRTEREEEERAKAKRKRENRSKGDGIAFVAESGKGGHDVFAAREEDEQISKRKKLVLPTPQVNDAELETIAKIGQQGDLARELVGDGEGESSSALLGDYSDTPTMATTRTPRTPAHNTESPAPSMPTAGPGTGFDGVKPRGTDMATPNPFAQSLPNPAAPGSQTAVRDQLGLNTPAQNVASTPREQKMASRGLREQLARKLASLPKPKNEFEVVEEIQVGPPDAVEDQTDVESRLAKEREEREEAELRRRSKPVQLNLPRPDALSSEILAVSVSSGLPPSHPVPNAPVLRGARSADAELEEISDDLLEQARAMVATEIEQNMPQEMKQLFESAGKVLAATAWASAERSETWLPAANKYVATSEISNGEWIEKYSVELAQHRELMAAEAARATKAERKLGITLGGYQARAKALTDKIITAHKDFEQAKLDSEAFASLYTAEQAAIPARIEKAEEELKRRRDALKAQLAQEPAPAQ